MDGSVSFERPWSEYVAGFGDVDGNFWLGLQAIHCLTSAQSMRLQIDIVQVNTVPLTITYLQFDVGDAASEYLLTVDSDANSDTTGYGTLHTSFNYHSGSTFTTYDHGNDQRSNTCAINCRAGWWFVSCHYLNLNGVYGGTMAMTYLSSHSNEPIRKVTLQIRAN